MEHPLSLSPALLLLLLHRCLETRMTKLSAGKREKKFRREQQPRARSPKGTCAERCVGCCIGDRRRQERGKCFSLLMLETRNWLRRAAGILVFAQDTEAAAEQVFQQTTHIHVRNLISRPFVLTLLGFWHSRVLFPLSRSAHADFFCIPLL
jgi:hypothetical protein